MYHSIIVIVGYDVSFSINYNKNQIVNVDENSFHHKSNAYKRRFEGNDGKNILALMICFKEF